MVSYVMSIKKKYGMNLLEGRSLWEYRRRRSRIDIGDKIILYATVPDRELIGEFIVGKIIIGNSDEVWEKTKGDVCYSLDEVLPYLKSGKFPIAFQVTKPHIYQKPIELSKIPFFKPPMSYCKASDQLLSKLI